MNCSFWFHLPNLEFCKVWHTLICIVELDPNFKPQVKDLDQSRFPQSTHPPHQTFERVWGLKWGSYLVNRHILHKRSGIPSKEDNFHGRQPLMEDGLWWKTTFDERQPMMEDDLRMKTTPNNFLSHNLFRAYTFLDQKFY